MSKSRKQSIPADVRQLQRGIAGVQRVMWLKRGIPLALLTLWTLVMLLCLWIQGTPEEWRSDTVHYVRLESQQVRRWSQHGSRTKQVDVLIAEDGREFRIRDGAGIQGRLSAGEACSIVYEKSFLQTMHIRALTTKADGELIRLTDNIEAHHRTVIGLWWMLAGGDVLCLAALALMEMFGLKTERIVLAELQQGPARCDQRRSR